MEGLNLSNSLARFLTVPCTAHAVEPPFLKPPTFATPAPLVEATAGERTPLDGGTAAGKPLPFVETDGPAEHN